MKTEIRETYRCDFCNKFYLMKTACLKHEERCHLNPSNNRLCYECDHLDKKKVESVREDDHGNLITYDLYFCKKVDACLHPPKVEFKGNAIELYEYENMPMKVECEHYKKTTFDDIFNLKPTNNV